MTNPELTPWFPADVKPVRVGYYEIDWYGDGNMRGLSPDYWDGKQWRLFGPSGDIFVGAPSWRGLAVKP